MKFSDIEGNYLNIQRIEVKEQTQKEDGSWNTPKYIVVDHAKTNAGLRKVYLTSKAREIIELIRKLNLKKYGNYCFSRYSKKQTEDMLEKALCG